MKTQLLFDHQFLQQWYQEHQLDVSTMFKLLRKQYLQFCNSGIRLTVQHPLPPKLLIQCYSWFHLVWQYSLPRTISFGKVLLPNGIFFICLQFGSQIKFKGLRNKYKLT